MQDEAIAELQTVRELSRQHREASKALAARRLAAIRLGVASGLSQTKIAAELDVTRQAIARHAQGGTQ